MQNTSIITGTKFEGSCWIAGATLNIIWWFTEVNASGEFKFSQKLLMNGQVIEESGGEGTSKIEGDQAKLVFADKETDFIGTIDLKDHKFTGTANQREGSATGGFDMKEV